MPVRPFGRIFMMCCRADCFRGILAPEDSPDYPQSVLAQDGNQSSLDNHCPFHTGKTQARPRFIKTRPMQRNTPSDRTRSAAAGQDLGNGIIAEKSELARLQARTSSLRPPAGSGR